MPHTSLTHSLQLMRQRICNEKLCLSGSAMVETMKPVESLLATIKADGTWNDINYHCDNLKDWDAAKHLNRLLTLSIAWYAEESPYHDNEKLFNAIMRGLDYWYDQDPQNPNWWWNQIGAPLVLSNCLLYLMDHCGQNRIDRAVPLFERIEPIYNFTGQNLIWMSGIRIRHGIITHNPALTSEGFINMGREVVVMPRAEGIQPDMSFFQHELLLYSGGYGAGFICDVSDFIALAHGTDYQWPEPKIKLLSSLILDGTRWMVRGRTFDPGVLGREITRAGHDASRFFLACERMASFESPRKAEFEAVLNAKKKGSTVKGNTFFWCADLMTHHREDYYTSVRLASNRVLNADWPCCGGEGRLNHHMADGATFFMKDGDEYRDIYPVWNWQQIPGTTAEQIDGEMNPDELRRYGERACAGGVSNGTFGCTGMDFSRNALTAKKAVFLFEHSIVCLGTGITSSSPFSIRTTIDQCHLRGETKIYTSNGTITDICEEGSRIEHDGSVYTIISGSAKLSTAKQSGAWSDCGVDSEEVLHLPVFNLGIDHGRTPTKAQYAYTVTPVGNKNESSFEIKENTENIQAVWSISDSTGMAIFYAPGEVRLNDNLLVKVDRPAAVIFQQKKNGELSIAASDPAQGTGVLKINFGREAEHGIDLNLPSGDAAGKSVSLTIR